MVNIMVNTARSLVLWLKAESNTDAAISPQLIHTVLTHNAALVNKKDRGLFMTFLVLVGGLLLVPEHFEM